MTLKSFVRSALFALLFFTGTSVVMAGEATDRIKAVSDKIFSIISDQTLQGPENKDKKEQMIMDAVDGAFDWEEFSRRALGRHWSKRTDIEKKEFTALFKELIKRTYMEKSGQYSGGRVEFLDEGTDEKYGEVKSQLVSSSGTQTPVDYRLMKKDGTWWVYDVYIEGVSLVSNYRSQFNDILIKSSFDELMKRLKEKIEIGA